MKIPFNRSPVVDTSADYIAEAFRRSHLSGDGFFTDQCTAWLKETLSAEYVLLTTSGSHALDMAAYLCGLAPGDEVIMPSYTFSSTANAFLSRGVKIVFVDIRPDTMNIDEKLIESAVSSKTRAIVPVHYAGVGCEMDTIHALADRYGLRVVEDAAQAVMSKYKGVPLGGGISDFGCFSFHETKNFSMGEGGALVIKGSEYAASAEIIREKGTDRSKFFRGEVDKYSWVEWGSSYLPSELNAAYLWSQLEIAEEITADRMTSWSLYYDNLNELGQDHRGVIDLPCIPEECTHNAHMFYIKVKNLNERTRLISALREARILAPYHYVPLHSSKAGKKYAVFKGEDVYTTKESERLVRLPMFYGLKESEIL
jgi:dTDP-4-amino-4,6-dideoxygalactose transaminase